jgi:hypothetical protein
MKTDLSNSQLHFHWTSVAASLITCVAIPKRPQPNFNKMALGGP